MQVSKLVKRCTIFWSHTFSAPQSTSSLMWPRSAKSWTDSQRTWQWSMSKSTILLVASWCVFGKQLPVSWSPWQQYHWLALSSQSISLSQLSSSNTPWRRTRIVIALSQWRCHLSSVSSRRPSTGALWSEPLVKSKTSRTGASSWWTRLPVRIRSLSGALAGIHCA